VLQTFEHKKIGRTMDWRLISAVSAAGGSLCLLAIGAYAVITANPVQPRKYAPAPALLSEYRASNAAGASARVGTSGFSLTPNSAVSLNPEFPPSPFATPIPASASSTVGAAGGIPALDLPRISNHGPVRPPPSNPEPRHEPRVPGVKAASLTPAESGPKPEPAPRPVVEVKKSFLPEIHAAVPAAHYAGVLTSAEIVRIKHSLRLTPDQEPSWPPVEAALGEMGRQQIALIRRGQEPRVSPNDWPPQRLFSIAGPLLRVLRPEQKEQIRRLCRSMGFESVASLL
jgi:hypothetical protein